MSTAEKLQTIAENMQNVFNAGKTEGQAGNSIKYWQPDVKYKVGDVCFAGCMVNDWPVDAICLCIEEHTSDYTNAPTNYEQKVWEKRYISADQSYKDVAGNVIHTTYATKEEVLNTLETINEVLADLVEGE